MAALNRCASSSTTVPCGSFDIDTNCPPDRCVWNEDQFLCLDKGEQVPCSDYEVQTACTSNNCQWDVAGDLSGLCRKPGELLACVDFEGSTGINCPTDRCKFYPSPINLCWAKNKPVPCYDLPESACVTSSMCSWTEPAPTTDPVDSEGSCGPCLPAGADCSEPYTGPTDYPTLPPDTPVDCSTFKNDTVYKCPEPDCVLRYANPTYNGCSSKPPECVNPTCDDLFYDENGGSIFADVSLGKDK